MQPRIRASSTCLLLALSLSVTCLTGCITHHEPIPWERWRPSYPDEYGLPLAEKASRIEQHVRRVHLAPEGVLVYRRSCTEFDPSRPDAYTNLADQPIWSGALCAALAFKYGVTEQPADRDLLFRVLDGLELLQAVTGKPGLLSRAVAPGRHPVPRERPEQEWRPASAPYEEYRYRGNVSKDQYFGVLLGYATTALVLGVDATHGDPEVRDRLRRPTCAIADHLWENGLKIVDTDGEVTTHGDVGGFFLCIPLGPNAALSLGFQRLAFHLSGETRFLERYEELLQRGYARATHLVKFEIFGRTNHNNDNMAMMALFALANLETDPSVLEHYEHSLTKLWRYTRNEGNAFFHLVYASRFPLPSRYEFDLAENLRLFPVDRRRLPIDVRGREEVERDCFSNRFGVPKNRTALPSHLRERSSFMWSDCPFALYGDGDPGGEICVSGVDFLLPYWMGWWLLSREPGDVSNGQE